MQPGRKMSPHQQYERDLSESCPGIDPQIGNLIGVIDVDACKDARAARVYDVHEEEIRNAKSEQNLDCLPRWHVIVAAPKQYQQRDSRVSAQTAIQQQLPWQGMPQRHNPWSYRLLRAHRNQAEGVVRQMHRDVQPDDKASYRAQIGDREFSDRYP